MAVEAFKKFCKDIDFKIPLYLSETKIISVEQIETEFEFKIQILFPVIPIIGDFEIFLNKVKDNFQYKATLIFDYEIKDFQSQIIYKLLELSLKFFHDIDFGKHLRQHEIAFDFSTNTLTLKAFNNESYNFVNQKQNILNLALKNIGLSSIEIDTMDLRQDQSIDIIKEQIENEFRSYVARPKIETTRENSLSNTRKLANQYFSYPISEVLISEEKNFVVSGTIYSIESIKTKTDLVIFTILISDLTEAIYAKAFIKKSEDLKFYKKLEKGMKVNIKGQKSIDRYSASPILSISKIEIIPTIKSELDKAELKRVEFGLRTAMTSMDGFISPSEFVKRAKEFGHSALAIVDKNSVQAFPEFFAASKKSDIKAIYGVTLSAIEKNNGIVFSVIDKKISDETFIVFDIETTGLSPIMNDIIEFGAVKLKNGKVVDRESFFIKTNTKLSAFTKSLTGISDSDMESAVSQEEGLKKIKDYIQDFTLIAHNAKFDVSFLIEKFKQYNLGKLENQWIDSLALSWYLIPDSKRYNLEIIAKKTAVIYNKSEAHRADYDAEVLARIWMVFLGFLHKQKIYTFYDLEQVRSERIFTRKWGLEYSFLARNQAGLKKIFQLVSKAHTTSFFGQPKIFLEDIKKDKDLLIGQIGINSALFEKLLFSSWSQVKSVLKKCDFISIPPIDLFIHKFRREDVDREKMILIVKKLIYLAMKMNIIVIADGDVRYLSEHEADFHEIYIHAKGLMGTRHYLSKEGEINPKYPKQIYLSTEQMLAKFKFLNSEDLAYKLVVENTNLLASFIDDNIEVIKSKLYTPYFKDADLKLKNLVYESATKQYGQELPKIVEKRIKRELEPIIKYNFAVIYWISHILVKKSLDDGYLVGSRGSVGSSLVATLAGITEVNPLPPHYYCLKCHFSEFFENQTKYNSGFDLEAKKCPNCLIELIRDGQNIPFETFLGFEANKVPDIDLNFSGEYQATIHQEVKKIFGDNFCFRAGTISTVAEKSAYGLAKKWNEDLNKNKSNAFIDVIAKRIYGSKRTTGQHPGGIIIVPKDFEIEDFSPINYPANDINSEWKTTHFDFHAIHDNLLKLDLLGHDDPTAIKLLEKLTNVKAKNISFYDKKIISLFNSTEALGIKPTDINGETTGAMGLPEFGTNFVRKMLLTAKPNSFADLVSVSGLSHGTAVWKDNAEDMIVVKKLSLRDVISCRDDIMSFLIAKGVEPLLSFQIMEKVRKGKGVSIEEEKILLSHDIPLWYIDSLRKIKYMFPKAHATAYVMMAWRIAYFKLYYPLEYYAVYFSARADFFNIEIMSSTKEKITLHLNKINERLRHKEPVSVKEEKLIPILEILIEAMARGIKISPISLYKSDAFEWIIDRENNSLIPPFSVVDGLGSEAAKSILREREKAEFQSIENLVKRTSLNRTNIAKLKENGVLKDLDVTDQIKLF